MLDVHDAKASHASDGGDANSNDVKAIEANDSGDAKASDAKAS